MTIEKIIEAANILADESIDFDEMVTFFNRAVSKINLEAGTLFPIAIKGDDAVGDGNLEEDYWIMREVTFADTDNPTSEETIRKAHFQSANQMFTDMVIIQYIHYAVKVQDATEYEWKASYDEWDKNMKEFIARFKQMINPVYLSQNVDIDGEGTKNENGFGIYVVEQGPFSDEQTWGTRPTPGNGNVTSSSVKGLSTDPYGLK